MPNQVRHDFGGNPAKHPLFINAVGVARPTFPNYIVIEKMVIFNIKQNKTQATPDV